MSQSLKMPKMPPAGIALGSLLGSGALVGWLNYIAVTKFGWAPYAYCAGQWVVYTLALDALYAYIWFGAIAYAGYLMVTGRWKNAIISMLACVAIIQAPYILKDAFKLGGTCPGDRPPVLTNTMKEIDYNDGSHHLKIPR